MVKLLEKISLSCFSIVQINDLTTLNRQSKIRIEM